MSETVVRFAPSPTGYLHLGGARTALYNWLFARKQKGRFLLRIEDTDVRRSTEESSRAILDGLTWLGMDWDGDPLFQSTRFDIHRAAALRLVEQGLAYRCACTAEELERKREEAKGRGLEPKYDRTCRDRNVPAHVPHAVRFKMPLEGSTTFEDILRGMITVPNSELDDLIILRSDGMPTYNFSVVIDDHDMGITHVIRGDDHLTNTPRPIKIYEILGWPLPRFAHLPLIAGLSKRKGSDSVQD
jgi:glutamyl-tRNA synthetase